MPRPNRSDLLSFAYWLCPACYHLPLSLGISPCVRPEELFGGLPRSTTTQLVPFDLARIYVPISAVSWVSFPISPGRSSPTSTV